MANLQVIKSWGADRISIRLNFLVQCANRNTSPLSQAFALTQAAELAFASGEFSTGWKLLEAAFAKYAGLPTEERLPTPTAVLGAILGRTKVTVAKDQLKIAYSEWDDGQQSFPWTAPTNLLAKGIGDLLAAAILSHSSASKAVPAQLLVDHNGESEDHHPVDEARADSERRHWLRRRLLVVAASCSDALILSAFSISREEYAAFETLQQISPRFAWRWQAALIAREERYAAQIRLVPQDWSLNFRPWASLIDWGLLCWEIAVRSAITGLPQIDDSVHFIRGLAADIADRRPPPSPDL